jgi:hypothetical protein
VAPVVPNDERVPGGRAVGERRIVLVYGGWICLRVLRYSLVEAMAWSCSVGQYTLPIDDGIPSPAFPSHPPVVRP